MMWLQTISPDARKLGEKVMTNCAAKLKTGLKETVHSFGIALDEYASVVADILTEDTVFQNSVSTAGNGSRRKRGRPRKNRAKDSDPIYAAIAEDEVLSSHLDDTADANSLAELLVGKKIRVHWPSYKARKQDEEAPEYTNPDLFSLEIKSKGVLGKWTYYGGKIDWFDYCDVNRLSIIEVKEMVSELGVEVDVELFWLQPRSGFNKGIKALQSASDIVEICEAVRDNHPIKIYVNHLTDTDIKRKTLQIESKMVDKDGGFNYEFWGKYAKNFGVLIK
ncbi:hypothetical protein LINPERHAP2_LOCUS40659 [Linum perenne]